MRSGDVKMRETVWWEDIKDGLYNEKRFVAAIDAGWVKIVREAKNFFIIEASPETLSYIRETRTEYEKAIDYLVDEIGLPRKIAEKIVVSMGVR